MRTTPRVIFILKQANSAARVHKALAQKLVTTWWQEFTRKSHSAPPVHHQESRKRTILPVNRNSAVEITLLWSKQTKSYWLFSSWQITTILQTFILKSTEYPNCQNRSWQRCPVSTGKMRSSGCLKIQTRLKLHYQLTEVNRNNYFHYLMRGDALQTFKNINGPARESLRELLGVFNSETQIPEIHLQCCKSKVGRFSWLTSKTGQRRTGHGCPCHHRIIHICQNATTPEEINKLGPFGEWHVCINCHTTGKKYNWTHWKPLTSYR